MKSLTLLWLKRSAHINIRISITKRNSKPEYLLNIYNLTAIIKIWVEKDWGIIYVHFSLKFLQFLIWNYIFIKLLCYWSAPAFFRWKRLITIWPFKRQPTKWSNTLLQFFAVADKLLECVWTFCGVAA